MEEDHACRAAVHSGTRVGCLDQGDLGRIHPGGKLTAWGGYREKEKREMEWTLGAWAVPPRLPHIFSSPPFREVVKCQCGSVGPVRRASANVHIGYIFQFCFQPT